MEAAAVARLRSASYRAGAGAKRVAVRIRAEGAPTWALGSLVALLTWRFAFVAPIPSLDGSWSAGLSMAIKQGLDFGSDVVFTYGPLGFLHAPDVWFGDLAVLAFLYGAGLYVAICTSLVWALRRSLGWVAAALVSLLAMMLMPSFDQVIILAAIWSLAILSPEPARFPRLILVIGGSLFAAVETLFKVSNGPLVFLLCAIALFGARVQRRGLALFGGLYVAALLLLWLVTGQSVSELPGYLRNSFEVVAGYGGAMALDGAPSWQLPVAIGALVAVAAASAGGAYRDGRARSCAVAVTAIVAFAFYKENFIRSDVNHTAIYFASVCILWLVIPWSLARRGALAGALALGAISLHAAPQSGANLDLIANVKLATEQARTLLSSGRRQDLTLAGRTYSKATYRLDPETLAELRGHTTSIDPWDIGVAYTYDLDWSPLPVIQSYVAYTPHLDGLNADFLEGAGAPQRILRENTNLIHPGFPTGTLDDRFPGWDPPRQARETLCHYAPLRTTPRWQVLGRVSDRCGPPRPAGTVEAAFDESVDVPAPGPGELVFARVHGAEVEGLERLQGLLFRPSLRYAAINDGTEVYRLPPALAGDGLMLRASPSLLAAGPFSQIPQAENIEITGQSGSLRYEFFRMSVR